MNDAAHATFTLRQSQEKLGLSRTVLAGLIAAGFVTPARGPRNAHRFTFQDLTLLRTAYGLQQSGVPPRKILKSLARLKAALPDELPLTGLRITAIGSDVAVRGRQGTLEAAASGQLLLDFEVSVAGAQVAFIDRGAHDRRDAGPATPLQGDSAAVDTPGTSVDSLVRLGEACEASGDAIGAESAYRQAIALWPDSESAYLNLGAMLCEAGRCDDAVELYESAVQRRLDSSSLWFNRGIALEDQQRIVEAIASYERSLALDPALADAHFNLGRLRERVGDARGAVRHFSAYRRLRP